MTVVGQRTISREERDTQNCVLEIAFWPQWGEDGLAGRGVAKAGGRKPCGPGGRPWGGGSRCTWRVVGAVKAGNPRSWCLLGCWGERGAENQG